MAETAEPAGQSADPRVPQHCPRWCTVTHGRTPGDEDWAHAGEPIAIADGVHARICMSVDPRTGVQDGPYVLLGSEERSLAEAETLGRQLISLAAIGRRYVSGPPAEHA